MIKRKGKSTLKNSHQHGVPPNLQGQGYNVHHTGQELVERAAFPFTKSEQQFQRMSFSWLGKKITFTFASIKKNKCYRTLDSTAFCVLFKKKKKKIPDVQYTNGTKYNGPKHSLGGFP